MIVSTIFSFSKYILAKNLNINTAFFSTSLLFFMLFSFLGNSQALFKKNTAEDYINLYKEEAIKNMEFNGIPASITLAQGMLESAFGNSYLARKANNHFGIKCHSDWTGKKVYRDDDRRNECFRRYPSVLESYADHANFLSSKSRYAFLFDLKKTDYKAWARGLKKAGYATNPRYADKLIKIIEQYELYTFDTYKPTDNKYPNAGLLSSFTKNKRRAILVQEGETKESLAAALDIKVSKLERFNELGKGDKLYSGQLLYLQRKRYRATKEFKYHTVEEGETLYGISQKYGIRYLRLLKLNNKWYGSEINPGEVLHLRRKRPLY